MKKQHLSMTINWFIHIFTSKHLTKLLKPYLEDLISHLNSDSYNETMSVFGDSLKEDTLKALSLITDLKLQ